MRPHKRHFLTVRLSPAEIKSLKHLAKKSDYRTTSGLTTMLIRAFLTKFTQTK